MSKSLQSSSVGGVYSTLNGSPRSSASTVDALSGFSLRSTSVKRFRHDSAVLTSTSETDIVFFFVFSIVPKLGINGIVRRVWWEQHTAPIRRVRGQNVSFFENGTEAVSACSFSRFVRRKRRPSKVFRLKKTVCLVLKKRNVCSTNSGDDGRRVSPPSVCTQDAVGFRVK